jgi:hypothetical protein
MGGVRCTAIDALSGYHERHQALMDYPHYREAGYLIASAAIESTTSGWSADAANRAA